MSVVDLLTCRYSAWRDSHDARGSDEPKSQGAGRGGCGHHSGVCRMLGFGADGPRPEVPQTVGAARNASHGPFFPECGGVSDQEVISQTRVPGLVNTAKTSVGCQWLSGGSILGPHFSFTWFRGSPIGRERKTEELSRTSVEDINIEGHDGFIATGDDPTLGTEPVRDRHRVRRRLHRMVDQLHRAAVPGSLRRRQGTHPPVDCELQMRRAYRPPARWRCLVAALAALSLLTGLHAEPLRAPRPRRAPAMCRATTTPNGSTRIC